MDWDALRDKPYVLHVLCFCFLIPPQYFCFYYVRPCLSFGHIIYAQKYAYTTVSRSPHSLGTRSQCPTPAL